MLQMERIKNKIYGKNNAEIINKDTMAMQLILPYIIGLKKINYDKGKS